MKSNLSTAALATIIAVSGCSDRKLVPVEIDQPAVVDDLVDIETEFCTRPVEDVVFPVKLLLVLDTSASLQFTDQGGLRRGAVRQLMSNLATQNDVQVATIGFGSNVNIDPPIGPDTPLFVPASQWVEPPFIGLADVTTSYHGALAAIKSHILLDLLRSDPAEVSRSKYIIIFFSDGAPLPVCCIDVDETVGELGALDFGCAPEAFELPQPGLRYCDGAEEAAVCNDEDFLERFRNNNPAAAAPDFGDGALAGLNELESNDNYNRTFQIEDLVTDIMDLGVEFGVGEMRFHTALLFDSTLPDDIKVLFRLNNCRSLELLKRMAELGNGIFRNFENNEEIDFLGFSFTSLRQNFTLLRAYAQNASALPPTAAGDVAGANQQDTALDFLPDTDGDGLDDATEQELGTDVASSDSDKLAEPPAVTQVPEPIQDPAAWGDGYGDLFEKERINIGFDPRFQSLPVDNCVAFDPNAGVDRLDLDGDGLNGCEEDLVQTDPKRADSDGDGLTDGLELRFGLDPATPERNRDDDFDGLPNADEVVKGLDPLLADQDRREETGIRYELINTGDTDDGRTCYKSIARGVHLANTAPRFVGGRSGYNDVLFWIAEAPSDSASRVEMRVACHRAQYLKPSFKDPANGKIFLTEKDFFDLSDPADLQRLSDGEDLCGGLEVR
ncbi:MAG: hypothetical protein Q8O67_15655 [Deltaproteobacteria bacterium]|nr:hypothetical protein [Deltaproteobacteria bacterium]